MTKVTNTFYKTDQLGRYGTLREQFLPSNRICQINITKKQLSCSTIFWCLLVVYKYLGPTCTLDQNNSTVVAYFLLKGIGSRDVLTGKIVLGFEI